MDISDEKNKSHANETGSFSAVLHAPLSIVRWLIGFFTLTEEDRLKAGIHVGDGKGRDDG